MSLNIVLLVASYLHMSDYAQYSQAENIGLYYVVAQSFCATVWASRTSILFTVMRLTGPASTLRRGLMFVFVAFLVIWAILFAQAFWVCESEPGWKSDPRPQCDLGESVAIAQIITDVIGDTLLIIIPCQLVYKVRLSWAQKIRIISIFSASAITTIVCLVHAYFLFTGGGLREAMAALFETSVSLIVANLSVIVAFLFRIGTEETVAFSPKELKSIVTFGSQPIRPRIQRDPYHVATLAGVEATTVALDDFGTVPSSGIKAGSGSDLEADMPAKAELLSDA